MTDQTRTRTDQQQRLAAVAACRTRRSFRATATPGSIAIASNHPFSEWGRTFTDPRLGWGGARELLDVDLLEEGDPFEVAGDVLVVPIAPSRSGDSRRCRPIGCYIASRHLDVRYREDR